MKLAINRQLRHAVALSMFFHAAILGFVLFIALHLPAGRALEYIQVELIPSSLGERRTSAPPDVLRPAIPGKSSEHLSQAKSEPAGESITSSADKTPAFSHDAAPDAQKIKQTYGNGAGARQGRIAYQSFNRLEKVPSFKVQVKPVYPAAERAAGVETRVIVEVYISAQGEVDDVELVKSGGVLFDKAVVAAVRESIFEPGYLEGQPVAAKVQIPYLFKLR